MDHVRSAIIVLCRTHEIHNGWVRFWCSCRFLVVWIGNLDTIFLVCNCTPCLHLAFHTQREMQYALPSVSLLSYLDAMGLRTLRSIVFWFGILKSQNSLVFGFSRLVVHAAACRARLLCMMLPTAQQRQQHRHCCLYVEICFMCETDRKDKYILRSIVFSRPFPSYLLLQVLLCVETLVHSNAWCLR